MNSNKFFNWCTDKYEMDSKGEFSTINSLWPIRERVQNISLKTFLRLSQFGLVQVGKIFWKKLWLDSSFGDQLWFLFSSVIMNVSTIQKMFHNFFIFFSVLQFRGEDGIRKKMDAHYFSTLSTSWTFWTPVAFILYTGKILPKDSEIW